MPTSTDQAVSTPGARPGYVPVERRWLGLDRRSLPAAIVVAVVGILFGGILPLLNQAHCGGTGQRLGRGANSKQRLWPDRLSTIFKAGYAEAARIQDGVITDDRERQPRDA